MESSEREYKLAAAEEVERGKRRIRGGTEEMKSAAMEAAEIEERQDWQTPHSAVKHVGLRRRIAMEWRASSGSVDQWSPATEGGSFVRSSSSSLSMA